MRLHLNRTPNEKPKRTRSPQKGPGPILSLLVAEVFLATSILPAWALPTDSLRPRPTAQIAPKVLSQELAKAADGGDGNGNPVTEFVEALDEFSEGLRRWETEEKRWVPETSGSYFETWGEWMEAQQKRFIGWGRGRVVPNSPEAEALQPLMERFLRLTKDTAALFEPRGFDTPRPVGLAHIQVGNFFHFLLGQTDRAVEHYDHATPEQREQYFSNPLFAPIRKAWQALAARRAADESVKDGGRKAIASVVLVGSLLHPVASIQASIPKSSPSQELTNPLPNYLDVMPPLEVHLIGRPFLSDDQIQTLSTALSDEEGLEKPADDPINQEYRERIETLLQEYGEVLRGGEAALQEIASAIQKGQKVVLAVQGTGQTLQQLFENAQERYRVFSDWMRQRGFEDYEDKARQLLLLMGGEPAYLWVTSQAVTIYPLADSAVHEKGQSFFGKFQEAFNALDQARRKKGVPDDVIGSWHTRTSEALGALGRDPTKEEIEDLLRPLEDSEVKKKARQLILHALPIYRTEREQEEAMGRRLHQLILTQGVQVGTTVFAIVGDTRREAIAKFLKMNNIKLASEAKDGGVSDRWVQDRLRTLIKAEDIQFRGGDDLKRKKALNTFTELVLAFIHGPTSPSSDEIYRAFSSVAQFIEDHSRIHIVFKKGRGLPQLTRLVRIGRGEMEDSVSDGGDIFHAHPFQETTRSLLIPTLSP